MRGLCFTLSLLTAPSIAATFDRDDRIAVTRPDARLAPIGVVKGGRGVGHSTGFLVSECHVLTVKHAAGRVANVTGRRMKFRLPLAGPEGASAGSVVAAGTLDLVGDPNRLDRSQDWMLLRLDRCLGQRFGFLKLARPEESGPFRTSRPAVLQSAGYPIDRSWRRQLTLDPQCAVRGVSGHLMVHDCSSLPGNSGSPILATTWRDGQPTVEVVAIHSTAAHTRKVLPFRGEDASVATQINDVLPGIRAHLERPAPTTLAALPLDRQRSLAGASR